MKTKKEIEEMLGKVLDNQQAIDANLSGMTYAEGIDIALRWVMGELDDFNDGDLIDDDDCKLR